MKTIAAILFITTAVFAQQPYRSPLEEPARPANAAKAQAQREREQQLIQRGETRQKIEQMRAARIAATQDKEDAYAKGVLSQKDKENPNTQAVLTKTAVQLSEAKVTRDTIIRQLAELEAMQGVNPAKDADNRANIQISKNKLAELDLKIANLTQTKADLIAKRDEERKAAR